MQEKKEIKKFIEGYYECYFTDRDWKGVQKFFSSDLTGIGTGLHEFGSTTEKTLKLFEDDINELTVPINYTNLKIIVSSLSSTVATVISSFEIQTRVDDSFLHVPNLRNTFTLIKEENEWKILQFHVSSPNDQQEDKEIYPLQKMIKKNELLKEMVEEKTKELNVKNIELENSNNTKDRLFSMIAHDLRSPFNSLLGFIDVLDNKYEELDPDSHKKYIKTISNSSHLVFNLLDNLLSWSRLQQNKIEYVPTSVDIRNVINNSIKTQKISLNAKNITITNNIKDSIFVLCDEFMITTVLRNLLSNSVKFTPSFGSISISAEVDKSSKNSQLTISVQDSGVGIESNYVKTIFKSNEMKSSRGTNNEKGTGIGLTICKEFIDFHGTKIWAESKDGNGSKFSFNLNLF